MSVFVSSILKLSLTFPKATALESSIQKTAREDYEAMGGIWAGEAPNMKNRAVYSDFIIAQIKVIPYIVLLRFLLN